MVNGASQPLHRTAAGHCTVLSWIMGRALSLEQCSDPSVCPDLSLAVMGSHLVATHQLNGQQAASDQRPWQVPAGRQSCFCCFLVNC